MTNSANLQICAARLAAGEEQIVRYRARLAAASEVDQGVPTLPSISILSRDPNLFRKPAKPKGNRSGF